MTKRQIDVLVCVETYVDEHGYPPTIREIAERLGVKGTNGVHGHLRALERLGLVGRTPNASRGLRITARGVATLEGRASRAV